MTGGLRGSDIMECIEEGPEGFRGSKMKKCVYERVTSLAAKH